MYFRLSWKTWKALFIELVSVFYCIYFLLLLVIWLSVENMFSTEPIVAFLDLCSCYIFWLHLWVNKNVDGCVKQVYNMIISIDILLYRIVSYNFLRYRQISYRWVCESISYRIVTNHPIYTPTIRYEAIPLISIYNRLIRAHLKKIIGSTPTELL